MSEYVSTYLLLSGQRQFYQNFYSSKNSNQSTLLSFWRLGWRISTTSVFAPGSKLGKKHEREELKAKRY